MSTASASTCPSCHHSLSLYEGRCARCGTLLEEETSLELDLGPGLELDLDASPPPAPPPAPPVRKATPSVSAPVSRVPVAPVAFEEEKETVLSRVPPRVLLSVGLLSLVGAGAALSVQAALPERFPPLLTMLVGAPLLTGVPSDFFPPSAWALAVLPWGLFALALAAGHQLALHARAPVELDLKERTVAAVALHVLAVALGLQAHEQPGAALFAAALVGRLLSVAACLGVLSGVGQALLALARASEAPVTPGLKGRGWGSAARVGGARDPRLKAAWVGALVATVALPPAVWLLRSEARTCEPGTALRRMEDREGRRVSACVREDGSRHGREQVRAPDGRLLESGEYRAGQRHGTFRAWNERGVLLEERSFSEGQPHGTWTLYRPDGKRALELTYAAGALQGESTTYHANGNPRNRKSYQKGVAHGRHARWFESGLVEVEGAYNQGRPSGWWVRRNAQGKVVKQWSEGGLSADAETAGVSAVFMGDATLAASRATESGEVVELRAGHTREWWQERLAKLKARQEPGSEALYQLTLRRARANGFAVFEKPEGVELALQPVP